MAAGPNGAGEGGKDKGEILTVKGLSELLGIIWREPSVSRDEVLSEGRKEMRKLPQMIEIFGLKYDEYWELCLDEKKALGLDANEDYMLLRKKRVAPNVRVGDAVAVFGEIRRGVVTRVFDGHITFAFLDGLIGSALISDVVEVFRHGQRIWADGKEIK